MFSTIFDISVILTLPAVLISIPHKPDKNLINAVGLFVNHLWGLKSFSLEIESMFDVSSISCETFFVAFDQS